MKTLVIDGANPNKGKNTIDELCRIQKEGEHNDVTLETNQQDTEDGGNLHIEPNIDE